MKKFNKFYFEKYTFSKKTLKAYFYYSFDNKEFFEEKIDFKNGNINLKNHDDKIINKLLFYLHLALGISYYKLFPTKKLIIKSGFLDNYQVKFWKKFYLNGLGEFFITNDIDPKNLLCFENQNCSQSEEENNSSNYFINPPLGPLPIKEGKYKKEKNIWKNKLIDSCLCNNDKSLLLLGGGKDSIVSYSFIKDTDFDLFVFGKIDRIKKNVSKIIGKKPILVKREISENLFKLNKLGYYNGHVPITGIIAFVSVLYSYIYGYKNIILSNEKSSNEENITWKGIKINHQYSKSIEFEKDFSKYISRYIGKEVRYFSLLKGIYEYKIAEIFSKQKKFFKVFSSCNKNFTLQKRNSSPASQVLRLSQKGEIIPLTPLIRGKIMIFIKNLFGLHPKKTNWCNKCPKCVFVFLILSNFLTLKELETIFGKNLFESKSLENTFAELIGLKKHKPFECVGTIEESVLSFYRAIKKYPENNFYILEKFKKDILKKTKSLNMESVEKEFL